MSIHSVKKTYNADGIPSDRGSERTIRLDNTVTKLQRSKTKVIQSGNNFEFYDYQIALLLGRKRKKINRIFKKVARSEEYKSRSIIRAINVLRRLALSNFVENDKFLTLTFNDSNDFNINDLRECLIYYQKFIRKIKTLYPDFKYITVPEFQKRGAVHYHLICKFPFTSNDEIAKIWGHGYIKVKAITNPQGAAIYLTKYLSKKFDSKKHGHRLYYTSKNLEQPKVFYGEKAELIRQALEKSNKVSLSYMSSYQTPKNGKAEFKQYNREPDE